MEHQELTLEKRCREHARRHGWVCCKLERNGCKGIPDDLFISPREECVLVEFKKDDRQPLRPEQRTWLARFPSLMHVCHSFEEFCRALHLPE